MSGKPALSTILPRNGRSATTTLLLRSVLAGDAALQPVRGFSGINTAVKVYVALENFNRVSYVISVAMSLDTEKAAEYLAEHPRMMGVLFTIGMLVSQVAPVLASDRTGTTGP